jgi:peptide/nickel transport system substrate-binding protein
MPRRTWLSAGLLATGAVLLATARLAGASPPSAGIFRVGMAGASVQIDPQLSYISTGWWMEYATAAKLYNWTDQGTKLVPEIASRVAISNRGRAYTFFLRKGFRFSDGTPVTARNFAYAIDRAANKDLASPGAAFITDPNGANIVGAQEVNSGNGTHVMGVEVRGPYKLVIHLTKPDPSFLLKLTMPFFQATSTTLALTDEVLSPYPSAGPYAYAKNDANVLTSIRRNPYYKRGPGRMRPHHLAGVDVVWNLDGEDALQQVLANQLDEADPYPSGVIWTEDPGTRFGVNKTRFWTEPTTCSGFLLLNTRQDLLHDNLPMRKAINWVVNRTAYVAQAGPHAGHPWTHLLPPRFPGSIGTRRLQPYATTPRIEKARKLAAGHFGDGHIILVYRNTGTITPNQARIIRQDLINLGFDPAKIQMVPYSYGGLPDNWDVAVNLGWCPDYTDPYDFFHLLLHGYSGFGDPEAGVLTGRYRERVEQAEKFVGNRRLKAFGKLYLEITTKFAPYVPMRTYNNRYLFSNRVDPRSLAYSGVYSDWSIPALALK